MSKLNVGRWEAREEGENVVKRGIYHKSPETHYKSGLQVARSRKIKKDDKINFVQKYYIYMYIFF